MNAENIKKVTNQAIEQLIAALDEGRSETLTQYLAAIGRFHCYGPQNVLLVASSKTVRNARGGLRHLAQAWAIREEGCERNP